MGGAKNECKRGPSSCGRPKYRRAASCRCLAVLVRRVQPVRSVSERKASVWSSMLAEQPVGMVDDGGSVEFSSVVSKTSTLSLSSTSISSSGALDGVGQPKHFTSLLLSQGHRRVLRSYQFDNGYVPDERWSFRIRDRQLTTARLISEQIKNVLVNLRSSVRTSVSAPRCTSTSHSASSTCASFSSCLISST